MAQYMCALAAGFTMKSWAIPSTAWHRAMLFADIPDEWLCPECGVGKDDFYLLDFVI